MAAVATATRTIAYRNALHLIESPVNLLHMIYLLLFFVMLLGMPLSAASQAQIRTLYHSLDPFSVSQQLAFYSLYANSQEGKAALDRACVLLSGRNDTSVQLNSLPL